MFKKLGIVAIVGGAALMVVEGRGDARTEDFPAATAERAYLCFEGATANEVMQKANEAGSRGWRLVAAAPGERNSVWCFEKFGASRPSKSSN